MPAPVADFTFAPPHGITPPGLTCQFTDTSAGDPAAWAWDFGDGATSTAQHPSHTYTQVGRYAVTLTVTNADGSNSKTIPKYTGPTGPNGPWVTTGR